MFVISERTGLAACSQSIKKRCGHAGEPVFPRCIKNDVEELSCIVSAKKNLFFIHTHRIKMMLAKEEKKGERKKIFKSLICFRNKMRYFLLSGYKDASFDTVNEKVEILNDQRIKKRRWGEENCSF